MSHLSNSATFLGDLVQGGACLHGSGKVHDNKDRRARGVSGVGGQGKVAGGWERVGGGCGVVVSG